MTRTARTTLALLLTAAAATAAAQGMKDMPMKDMPMKGMHGAKPGAATVHATPAKVVKVDREAGKVTLSHPPIASLDWPAMTMAFRVRDARLFDALVPGRSVDIGIVQEGRDHVVTTAVPATARPAAR